MFANDNIIKKIFKDKNFIAHIFVFVTFVIIRLYQFTFYKTQYEAYKVKNREKKHWKHKDLKRTFQNFIII